MRFEETILVHVAMRLPCVALAAVAWLCGLVGMIVPGVPTTPFILAASWLLERSSRSLHRRLLRSRIAGAVVRDWQDRPGVRPHVKHRAMLVTAAVLGGALWQLQLPLAPFALLLSAGVGGLLVIHGLPEVGAPSLAPREVRRPLHLSMPQARKLPLHRPPSR